MGGREPRVGVRCGSRAAAFLAAGWTPAPRWGLLWGESPGMLLTQGGAGAGTALHGRRFSGPVCQSLSCGSSNPVLSAGQQVDHPALGGVGWGTASLLSVTPSNHLFVAHA